MSEPAVNYGSLGQGDSYAVYTDHFDSSLLNPMPRKHLRERFKIQGDEFVGYDIWHCYESTFLLNSGLPVSGTLKFMYPCSSPNMVESKSMKLYLNSFDMCKMGNTLESAKEAYVAQIIKDLSPVVGDLVQAHFFDSIDWAFSAWSDEACDISGDCTNIAEISELCKQSFSDYVGEGSYITLTPKNVALGIDGRYYTNCLRSRCRHTKQKDSGTAIVWHDTKHNWVLDPMSFMRQVISLREVNEFHELCAEKLFTEIAPQIKEGDDLTILLLYSRRGSLDINPLRTSNLDSVPSDLLDVTTLTAKAQGQ